MSKKQALIKAWMYVVVINLAKRVGKGKDTRLEECCC